MALTTSLSSWELARLAAAAYEGKQVRVSLASIGVSGFTPESTLLSWDSIKQSGNGYADYKAVVATGAYDNADSRYEMGSDAGANTYIDAEFTATGAGYTYDRVFVVIGSREISTITNAALASNVATLTTAAAHGYSVGDSVTITGATNTTFNGTFSITTTTSTTFSYSLVSSDIASAASSGTAVVVTEEEYLHSLLTESPAITLSAGQTTTYRIQLAIA